MTQTTLERTIALLEREISGTSDKEKAQAARRLSNLFMPARSALTPARSSVSEDDDDMFNNMPI